MAKIKPTYQWAWKCLTIPANLSKIGAIYPAVGMGCKFTSSNRKENLTMPEKIAANGGNVQGQVVQFPGVSATVELPRKKGRKGAKGGDTINIYLSPSQGEPVQDQTDQSIPNLENLPTGHVRIELPESYGGILTDLSRHREIKADIVRDTRPDDICLDIPDNACCTIWADGNKALALFKKGKRKEDDRFVLVPKPGKIKGQNIGTKNDEQAFALALLLDPGIRMVSLTGKTGGGKTLMALLASRIMSDQFKHTIVVRPVVELGKSLGYLPGDLKEKTDPLFKAINANLALLTGTDLKEKWSKDGVTFNAVNELTNPENPGFVEMLTPNFLQGWTVNNTLLVLDETQNYSPEEILAIITRCGETSKVVLTGDCHQVLNTKVNAHTNGLAHVIKYFYDKDIYGHLHFTICERSRLAALADELLSPHIRMR